MPQSLTADQMERLRLAAERAELPGACRYVVDRRPCCVVAQPAVLERVYTASPDSGKP
jgi:hypothetical protein